MLLVSLGICLFVVHAIMYLIIHTRLRERGLVRSRWMTVISSLKMYRTYVRVAAQNHWSPSIGILAPTFLISSLVLIFVGVIRSGPSR
jgi:hypothetical protein